MDHIDRKVAEFMPQLTRLCSKMIAGERLRVGDLAQMSKLSVKEVRERLLPVAVQAGIVATYAAGPLTVVKVQPPPDHRAAAGLIEYRDPSPDAKPGRELIVAPGIRPAYPVETSPAPDASGVGRWRVTFNDVLDGLGGALTEAFHITTSCAGATEDASGLGESVAIRETPGGLDSVLQEMRVAHDEAHPAVQAQLMLDITALTEAVESEVVAAREEIAGVERQWRRRPPPTALHRVGEHLRHRLDRASAELIPPDPASPPIFSAMVDGTLEHSLGAAPATPASRSDAPPLPAHDPGPPEPRPATRLLESATHGAGAVSGAHLRSLDTKPAGWALPRPADLDALYESITGGAVSDGPRVAGRSVAPAAIERAEPTTEPPSEPDEAAIAERVDQLPARPPSEPPEDAAPLPATPPRPPSDPREL